MNHYENFLAMIKETSMPYATYKKDGRDYIIIYPNEDDALYFVFRSNHSLMAIYD